MAAADTIVAVSTAAGYSPRSVVRISGPDALACARGRFEPGLPGRPWDLTYTASQGSFLLCGARAGIPALLYVMRAPRSYTCEDVLELHLPGSPALLDLVLEDLVAHGPGNLRLAQPGEFTRRAFMNGRIDLSRAEAVLSVIRARSERELLAAGARLRGSVGQRCARFQDGISELRVQAEAALDFAEQGIEVLTPEEFAVRCARLREGLEAEASAGREAAASDGAIHVVICGAPNAGKSSLLNRLADAEHAIVNPVPGTTRDPVGAEVELGGVFFRLTDTAGLTGAGADVDRVAVQRAREAVAGCHLLLLVLDASAPLPGDVLEAARLVPGSRVLCVLNKADLPQVLDEDELSAGMVAHRIVRTSALTGEGVAALEEALWRTVVQGNLDASAADCTFNARQRTALRRACEELAEAERAVREGLGYEFAAVNLRAANDAIGQVTGQVTARAVLDGIFSRFCIGK